jgi:hypothetical protein
LNPDEKFPSTKEKTGYWLGVAEYVGDKLCFHILMNDTHRVIERSVVHSAERLQKNHTLVFPRDAFLPMLPIRTTDQSQEVHLDDDSTNEADADDGSDATPIVRNTDKSTDLGDRPKQHQLRRKHSRRSGRPRTRSRYDLRSRSKATHLANLVKLCGPKTEFLEFTRFDVQIFLPRNQSSLRIDHTSVISSQMAWTAFDRSNCDMFYTWMLLRTGVTMTTIHGTLCSSINIAW